MNAGAGLSFATVARVLVAALLILAGAVLLGHFRVLGLAYGERWEGWLAPGRRAALLRRSLALALAGCALWGWTLGWPWPVPAALGALALGLVAADLRARG